MRYIIFSDIHLSNYSGKVNPEEKISQRLVDQKSILQQLIDLAVEQDAILLDGGDVFHCVGAVPTEALNMYAWFLKEVQKCGIKYYATQGNHDLVLRKDGKQWHSILNLFQDKQQRDKELAEMKIRFVDYDEEDVYSIKGWDIIILHKQPACSNRYGFKHEGVDWKKVAKNNRLCFYGHFHETKKLGATSWVIGQPMQMTQADVGEKRGCWIVDSENWSVTFHKLDYPEIKKIEKIISKEEKIEERIKATSFNDILLEWLQKEGKDQSYLDLIKDDIVDKGQLNKTFFNGRIKTVYLKNFLSFDEIKIELKDGFWLVVGANGTGKTSIFEGIMWVLYDEVTKNLAKQEVVRDRPTKQKEAYGELCLVDDKCYYTIKRSSKSGLEILQDNKNLVEGMTKIQAQQFLVNNILGFDKNTFLAACYFSQKQLTTLAQLGDAATTNMVTNFLGFETYDSLHELMKERGKEVTLQLENLEKDSVKLDNDIWKNNEQQKSLKEQIEMFTKQECSLKDEQSKINQQVSEFNSLLVKIVIPSISTEEIDKSLSLLMSSKSEMSTKQRTIREDGQKRTVDLRKQLSTLGNDLTKILQEQAKIDKEKISIENLKEKNKEQILKCEETIKSLKSNKCSYCGHILNEEEIKNHLKTEEATLFELKDIVFPNNFESKLNTLYDQEAQNQELTEQINKQIVESDAEIEKLLSANQAEIIKIEEEIKKLQDDKVNTVKELTEANSRKVSLTQQIKQLEQRGVAIQLQLKNININDKLLQLKELEEIAVKLLSQKDTIICDKNKLIRNQNIYEFWAVAFGNKGIRSVLLDRFVNEINYILQEYCYNIDNGNFIVQFNPITKLQSGIERNKLSIVVHYKDKEVNYQSLSGGEETKANLPLCLGLNKWISKKYNIKNGILGIIILDEVFAHLDAQGRDSIAELLNKEGKDKMIFVIDHMPTLQSYTNNLWQVEKINDITQLQII